jgi:hypothetical protein
MEMMDLEKSGGDREMKSEWKTDKSPQRRKKRRDWQVLSPAKAGEAESLPIGPVPTEGRAGRKEHNQNTIYSLESPGLWQGSFKSLVLFQYTNSTDRIPPDGILYVFNLHPVADERGS